MSRSGLLSPPGSTGPSCAQACLQIALQLAATASTPAAPTRPTRLTFSLLANAVERRAARVLIEIKKASRPRRREILILLRVPDELDAALLTFLYCDPLLALLRLCTLRQLHCKHAVDELGLDLVRVHALRNRKAALEGTIATLGEIIILLLFLLLLVFLALDGQHAVGELHVDV